MIGLRAGRRAGPPEPSRCARPHRSRPLTGVLCRSRSPLLRCRGWHGLRPSRHFRPQSLLRHPGSHHSALAIHQNAPFGGRTALLSSPSTKTPHFVDELPFCLRHPPKRPIWWTNCPFVSAIHQNGSFGGWPPAPSTNRPGLGLVSRKDGAFSEGPSMPEACFPEGRCLFRGTFHARGLFPGRSRHYSWGPATLGPFIW